MLIIIHRAAVFRNAILRGAGAVGKRPHQQRGLPTLTSEWLQFLAVLRLHAFRISVCEHLPKSIIGNISVNCVRQRLEKNPIMCYNLTVSKVMHEFALLLSGAPELGCIRQICCVEAQSHTGFCRVAGNLQI